MHYSIILYKEVPLDITSFFDNATGVIFDLIIVFVILFFLFRGRIKPCLLVLFFISLTWSFSNIIYSRFFFQYISLSSVGQASNLFNTFMIKCIIDSLLWTDLLFIINSILFLWGYKHVTPLSISTKQNLRLLGIATAITCAITLLATLMYSITDSRLRNIGFIKHHLYTHHLDLYRNSANPNWTHFHRGSFRTLIQPMIQSVFSPQELTQEQKAIIAKIVNNQEEKMTNITTNANNVIFIIVESYLSATSDLVVNGKEITPYLNQLKRDSTVFYNGKLKSNITIGESGDGQFICMTGILPLRSQITVGRAKEVVLPGLPKVLAQKLGLYTRMLIPTTPSMWEQERMCQQYGIQKLYSCKDYSLDNEDLNDQQIFSFIQELDKESPKPFFSLVLTMSMHQPYTETRDPSFQICSPNLSKEYIKYLNACHYTDKQIGQYLDFLKKNGLYEKSLIVITADHHPNQNSIKMNSISNELPLYIINANIDNVSTWKGECNQLDVYTTILDITVKTPLEWRGLGNTLFSPLYKNSLSQEKWDISEWILQGDYFSK